MTKQYVSAVIGAAEELIDAASNAEDCSKLNYIIVQSIYQLELILPELQKSILRGDC